MTTGTRRGQRDPRYYPPRPPADAGEEHPGMANYPSDPGVGSPTATRRSSDAERQPVAAAARRAVRREHASAHPAAVGAGAGQQVTVTRAAAQRSREMGSKMYGLVHRAATADGADKSGLTALT